MSDLSEFDDITSLLDEYEDWTLSDTDSDDSLTLEYGKKKCHGSFFIRDGEIIMLLFI